MLTTIAMISQSRTSLAVSAVIRSLGRTFLAVLWISPSIFDVVVFVAVVVVAVTLSLLCWSKSRFLTYQMYLKKLNIFTYILDTFLLYFIPG